MAHSAASLAVPAPAALSAAASGAGAGAGARVSLVVAVRIKPVDEAAGQKDGFDEGRGAVTRDGAEGRVTIEMTTELGSAGAEDVPLPQSAAATAASSSTSSGRTSTKAFAPEHVFMPDSSQAAVYEACARDIVFGAVAGINGAVIACEEPPPRAPAPGHTHPRSPTGANAPNPTSPHR